MMLSSFSISPARQCSDDDRAGALDEALGLHDVEIGFEGLEVLDRVRDHHQSGAQCASQASEGIDAGDHAGAAGQDAPEFVECGEEVELLTQTAVGQDVCCFDGAEAVLPARGHHGGLEFRIAVAQRGDIDAHRDRGVLAGEVDWCGRLLGEHLAEVAVEQRGQGFEQGFDLLAVAIGVLCVDLSHQLLWGVVDQRDQVRDEWRGFVAEPIVVLKESQCRGEDVSLGLRERSSAFDLAQRLHDPLAALVHLLDHLDLHLGKFSRSGMIEPSAPIPKG
ncbi:hypothetical protein GS582_31990 [Rhodococcus hoagii]|nr:hypothetical protein [Prescottella equi]